MATAVSKPSESENQPSLTTEKLPPLCVDLDGTLVRSDTLVDSLLVLLRKRPLRAFGLIPKLFEGKAAFKAYAARYAHLDVAHLPYNRALVSFLQQEQRQGRTIYLATGADGSTAERVAKHLGFFAGVLASDGVTNLIGKNKLERMRQQLDSEELDYIGNAHSDLPLLAHARRPMVANPTLRLRWAMRRRGLCAAESFVERGSLPRLLIKAIRLHQWAKNLLIFAPLLLSHNLKPAGVLTALAAFLCFSMVASATYIFNDLLDIEADRRHARKRLRPFASGELSPSAGAAIIVLFLLVALAGATTLPAAFYGWLLLYLVATLSYTSLLKRLPLVDVLVLSGLYTLRLLAGSAATHTVISHWLAGFSIFLFLSLAFVKRFSELENLRASGAAPKNGRGYLVADQQQLRSFGTASAFAAVVVFANYISGREVTRLYHDPGYLWLMMPLMILWLCRVWLLASRGELSEDPVLFAITDKVSLGIGVLVIGVALLAL
jgi:4-hydroxybenzoate polyprenyltransferase/phosphoserine phosphatase